MFYKIIFVLMLLKNKSYADTNKVYASVPEVFYLDNYDNCMLREDEALYCSFNYVLEPVDKDNPSETWNIIKNLSAIETNYRYDNIRHYICVPKTCPGVNKSHESDPLLINGLEKCYNEKFKEYQLKGTMTDVHCETQDPRNPIDSLDVICGILFVCYIMFVIYATYYEVVAGLKTSEDYQKLTSTLKGKVLSAFSLSKNWIRLTTIKSTPEVEKLRSIQAIRFFNSALVVFTHTVLGFLVFPVTNTRYTETMFEGSSSIIFGSGHIAMATFFFISSFLLSDALFTYMKDKNGLDMKTVLWMFAFRCFRLMPTMSLMILFHATWLRHIGNGPFWDVFVQLEFKNCRKNSWTNLLFINNMVESDNMCLSTSWYLALSTHYFILSLLFIWLLKKYEKYIWYIVGGAVLLNTVGSFLQNYYYDFSSLILCPVEYYVGLKTFIKSPEFKNQLGSFIGNMVGPISGIAFGYYFNKHQREKPHEKIFNTKLGAFVFWTMCALGFSCVIVPGVVILYYSSEHSAFWASVYVALSRPIYTVSLGTFILRFTEEAGGLTGLVRSFCSWPPLYILGRLSYSVYMVHMSICTITASTARYPSYISQLNFVSRFYGDIVLVYIAAALLTLFVELPVSALQKMVFKMKEESKEEENVNNVKNK